MNTPNDGIHPNPDADSNPDPITGESGARPVGTGLGAAGAGVITTAAGVAVGGPIGGLVGAAVGAAVGGLVGKGIAETLDPTVEDAYWRENYGSRPYADPNYTYDDYGLAYRTGYEGYATYSTQGLSYQEAEPHLRQRYEDQRGSGRLGWERARLASQDAWQRVEYGAAGTDTDLR